MHRFHLSGQERRCRSRLTQLVHDEPLVHGTLTVRKVTCGKPNCRCARGEPHEALYLTCRSGGKSHQIFVPARLAPSVRQWVANDRSVRELLQELSASHIERLKDRKKER